MPASPQASGQVADRLQMDTRPRVVDGNPLPLRFVRHSFAVHVYDPDAPTGSGFWHWYVIDLPAGVTELAANAGAQGGANLPQGARQIRNDYGSYSWGGCCPPPGDKPHRYIFTVHALSVDRIDVPDDAPAALTGFMVNANTLAKASFTATYGR